MSRDVALVVRAAAVDEEQAEWLAGALSRPVAAPDALVDFLAGATRDGHPQAPSFYGCMQQHCKVGQGCGVTGMHASTVA